MIFLCSYIFFLKKIGYAVTVSNFSELFSYAATVFFPELVLHKCSVERYGRLMLVCFSWSSGAEAGLLRAYQLSTYE